MRFEDSLILMVSGGRTSSAPSNVSVQKVLDSVDLKNVVVSELCHPSGAWNSELIRNSFLPDDASLILSLPRLSPAQDDSLCWHFDKRGFYTVRSGYKVALDLKKGIGSSSMQLSPWWRFLWKCNIPNKCKIFFWKAFNGWLPTFATLARRRVDVVDYCQVCNDDSESITHILWSCNSAVEVWRQLLGDDVIQRIVVSDFPSIILSLWRSVDSVVFNLLIIGYWRLWTNRNSVVHGSAGWAAADMVTWIDNFANEFRLANELNHKEVLSHQPSWKTPKRGEFKINCDASFQLRSGKAGVGVIIRDYKGSAIAARSSPVLCCSSVEMLEAQACLEGIHLAIDIGVSGVIIESDAASVIQLLSDQTVPRTELGAIIHTSLALGASVNLLSYVAVRREANSVAHCIAQHALSLDSPVVWFEEMPPDIARLVRGDSPTSVCPF
ncbi:hypothetical protein EZV62_022911 [Acer yangbiense]|uniref:RNase H type-1 domain-containing protein n=1 Tax=Acer yangbiense TaxID=1000413 RepID=A0A5C7H0P0_9ROSI|nr:hypothetical protein EZV62_022911 [Acer yangbiense]